MCYQDTWERARPDAPDHAFTPRNPLVSENKPALDRDRRIDYVSVRCGDRLYTGPPSTSAPAPSPSTNL